MHIAGHNPLRTSLAFLALIPGGCTALRTEEPSGKAEPQIARIAEAPTVLRARYDQVDPAHLPGTTLPSAPSAAPAPAFAGQAELSADALVEQVLARNPTLAQMVAASQAAAARYPQVSSLEDPMFMGKLAPAAIGNSDVHDHFYMVEVSQKLPWCGKLALRGENALAEASAADHDVDDVRLQLIESARTAFYDYYLAARALEVNAENLDLLKKFEKSAEDRYTNGLAPQQDLLQARVEIGRERNRRLVIEETRRIAAARINTLIHLPPDSPLPPPPKDAPAPDVTSGPEALRAAAAAQRPDLRALADRIRADEAQLSLAYKEFCPDFEVAAGYDAFWDVRSQRPEVNVRLNLPIYLAKRRAAVDEAEARIAERKAELAQKADQINFQVQEAYEKVTRSEQSVGLYEKTILPDAKKNVEAARSAYETAKIPFVTLIEAQRNRVMLLDQYYEAVADYFRRRAALERAVGGPLQTPGSAASSPCR
jgi:outer membrane protein TolC